MKNSNKVKTVEFLPIRMSPKKYEEVKEQAVLQGLSAAAYGRQAIFEKLAAAKAA